MGCDIHLYTERKRSINNKEKWTNADNWKLNPYYDSGDESEPEYRINPACSWRNYTLFSILANVRNQSENKPIAEPKGLPADVTEIVKQMSDKWGSDGHSHSFFTMKELYDYSEDNKTVKYSGLVDTDGVKAIEAGEMPKWWCQGSTSDELVYKEWEYASEVIQDFIKEIERHFQSDYYDKEKDCEKYRIVFWFDN